MSPPLSGASKVTSAPKELREEVKWVVMALPAPLSMLGKTIVAIPIVDLSTFSVRQHLVRVGNRNKALMSFVVISVQGN